MGVPGLQLQLQVAENGSASATSPFHKSSSGGLGQQQQQQQQQQNTDKEEWWDMPQQGMMTTQPWKLVTAGLCVTLTSFGPIYSTPLAYYVKKKNSKD